MARLIEHTKYQELRQATQDIQKQAPCQTNNQESLDSEHKDKYALTLSCLWINKLFEKATILAQVKRKDHYHVHDVKGHR